MKNIEEKILMADEEIKGKVHSLPFTLDHENLKRVIFAKSTY